MGGYGRSSGWATCSVDNVYIEYNMMHWRKLDVQVVGKEGMMQKRHAESRSLCVSAWVVRQRLSSEKAHERRHSPCLAACKQ